MVVNDATRITGLRLGTEVQKNADPVLGSAVEFRTRQPQALLSWSLQLSDS